MRPSARIALATAALTLAPLSIAHAWELTRPQWRNQHSDNPFNRQSDVQNGRFTRTGGTLSGRTQKPGGGFYYNPVCKTPDGKVGAATPTTRPGSTWKWNCLGGDGELIKNGGDFTWEYYAQTKNRGSISIYSLTYEHNGQQRVVCKGRIGNEELPGWYVMPSAGGVPGACQVMVMGQTVPAKTFWTARRKASGTGQPVLSNGAGWIDRVNYNKGPQSEPLYRTTTKDGSKVICRVEKDGKWFPGVLVEKSFGSRKPGFACAAFMGTVQMPREFFDYQIHVSSKRASKFDWERYGNQTSFSKGVVLDEGNGGSTRRYVCQISANTVGYVDGTKKCRHRLNPAGANKFRLHIK